MAERSGEDESLLELLGVQREAGARHQGADGSHCVRSFPIEG